MIIYADVLIFINGIITYFLLLCVCAIFKFRPKTYRLIIGAVCGGVSALTIFLTGLNFITELLLRATVCAFIVLVTFSYRNKIHFLKYSLAFLTVTYIFGGGILAVCEIFEPKSITFANGVAYFDISPMFLILSCGAVYLFIRFLMLFRKNTASEQMIYDCIVEYEGVRVNFTGVNDTGNSLKDPYFSSPVVVIEKSVLQPILDMQPKTYLIPVRSVSDEGTLFAFRPSGFYVSENGKYVLKKDVTVCICDKKIHSQYSGILSPQIIEIGEDELCLSV